MWALKIEKKHIVHYLICRVTKNWLTCLIIFNSFSNFELFPAFPFLVSCKLENLLRMSSWNLYLQLSCVPAVMAMFNGWREGGNRQGEVTEHASYALKGNIVFGKNNLNWRSSLYFFQWFQSYFMLFISCLQYVENVINQIRSRLEDAEQITGKSK